ncbi:protein of unknown function [Hyphomicrobium sp. MC1]|nr:protein of unknown function [Hyphomicrobium sp. MC1]
MIPAVTEASDTSLLAAKFWLDIGVASPDLVPATRAVMARLLRVCPLLSARGSQYEARFCAAMKRVSPQLIFAQFLFNGRAIF